jgi:hypothetical protein
VSVNFSSLFTFGSQVHTNLQGMRERADHIGGKLTLVFLELRD